MDVHIRFQTKADRATATKIKALAQKEDRKVPAMVKRLVLEALRRRK